MKNLNKYLIILAIALFAFANNGCKKSDLEDLYTDPGKTSVATIDNFFTGVLKSANNYVMPWYERFFVIEQPTMGHYTQTMGWINGKDQYIPPTMDARWNNYYDVMTQIRQMELLYNESDAEIQAEYAIFMLAAKIFFYDQTTQIVDQFGDIPWSEAGNLRSTGDLTAALPKYDSGEEIYTAILADLESINTQLGSISLSPFVSGLFATKDYLNDGEVLLWQKYCNSLRLRMLMRVSDVGSMNSAAGINAILSNLSANPVVESNDENIMLDAGGPDLYATTSSMTGGIRSAMQTWGVYDIAPFAQVDFMNTNSDPRLPAVFDPNIDGEYIGMDPLLDATTQNTLLVDGLVSRYDTSTFTRNNYFPGFVISAAEVSFIKAEAYHRGLSTAGDAQTEYETGIKQSIEFYYNVNATGDYRTPLTLVPADVDTYIASTNISWAGNSDKMNLIATQKWLNTGLGQMPQTWAEYRRLDLPVLTFLVDNQSGQTAPPVRFLYPDSEKTLNYSNYQAVESKDNINPREIKIKSKKYNNPHI